MVKYKNIELQKPFIKWVGGKTQIIEEVLNTFPKEFNNYHEIFLGGGSVLLALLSLKKEKYLTINNKIYAYDINKTLIDLYKDIQNNKEKLYILLKKYIEIYDKITGNIINRKPNNIGEALTSKESYYYWIRNKYNNNINNIEKSAMFIFLNKTCFRGMYREGPNGFNVPYGHYKTTPTFLSKKDLNNISELIKDVIFIHSDFTDSFKNIIKGDFVYLDPPYIPENIKSFVNYNIQGFDKENHKKLIRLILKLVNKNIKFSLSNSNSEILKKCFKNLNIKEINAKRSINSKNPESMTIEIIISS